MGLVYHNAPRLIRIVHFNNVVRINAPQTKRISPYHLYVSGGGDAGECKNFLAYNQNQQICPVQATPQTIRAMVKGKTFVKISVIRGYLSDNCTTNKHE